MAELSVARTETKYTLDAVEAARLRATLAAVMPLDDHPADVDGYAVRSLYFDTVFDDDYHDKIDGLESRQKVRLRIYSSDDQAAKLELKRKVGAAQWKRSVTVPRADVDLLVAGRYGEVRRRLDSPFAQRLLAMMERCGYVPRMVIEFRRLAFVAHADNTRVTFDSGLRASESLFDLFAPDPAYHSLCHPVILEVKYTHYLLSHIKIALGLADQTPVSVSKYCLGRQISFY